MSSHIDDVAVKFASAWDTVKKRFNKLYASNAALAQSLSHAQLVQQIAALDMEKLILDDFGFGRAIDELAEAHIVSLRRLNSFADVDDAFLNGLININKNVYVGQIGASGAQIQSLMVESVTANLSEAQFASALETTGLQTHQANALANDSLRRYERTVTTEMANNADPNKLFVWSGPLDSKTSDIDREAIQAGEMTIEQWRAQFGGLIVSGAHVNCRHTLLPA